MILSSSPYRFHERNLHSCRDIWKIFFFVNVAKYLTCALMKYLIIVTTRSNLSLYWIRDTSATWRFSCFPTCHIKEVGLAHFTWAMKHTTSTRWLANPNWGYSHLHHIHIFGDQTNILFFVKREIRMLVKGWFSCRLVANYILVEL